MRETRTTAIPHGRCYNRGMNKIYESIEEGTNFILRNWGGEGFTVEKTLELDHFIGFLH